MKLSKFVPSARSGRQAGAASLVVAGIVLVASPADAQLPPLGEPGGTVSIVHAAAVTGPLDVRIDGVERLPSLPFASAHAASSLTAGTHEVSVAAAEGTATASVDIGTGCTVSVIAFRPDGARRAFALQSLAECPVPSAAPDKASMRLVAMSASVGSLTATVGAEQVAARVGEGSPRMKLPPGRSSVLLRRDGSDAVWRTVPVDVTSGHAYDLLIAGDGDTPIVTVMFDVAGGPPDPFAAGTVIPMGRLGAQPGPGRPWGAWVAGVAVVMVPALAARRHRGVLLPLVRHHRIVLVPLAAGVLLVTTAACEGSGGVAGNQATRPSLAPPPERPSAPVPTLPTAPPPVATVPTPGVPVRIKGPRVNAAVRPFANARIPRLLTDLPGAEVAWLSGTALPGNRGVSVLAGHVVWGRERAVFGYLRDLRRGDVFEVTDSDGRSTSWEVEGAITVRKGELPGWLTAPHAVPRLALVTCDGTPVNGSHPDNLVVVARLA